MTDLTDNPIYKRMIEGSRGPSARACAWIGVAIAIAACVVHLYFISGYHAGGDFPPVRLVIVGHFLTPVFQMVPVPIFTFAAMILTARRAARLAANEDFALVRISGLAEGDIVQGYTEGARYRVRLWIATTMGALASFVIGQGFDWMATLTPYIFDSNGVYGTQELANATKILTADLELYAGAIMIVLSLTIDYWVTWPLALTGAVWAALRSPRNAPL